MKYPIFILAAAVTILNFLSGCNEENKVRRKLSGTTWKIELIEGFGYYTGECGVAEGTYDEWSVENAGTYRFTDEGPTLAGTDDEARGGSLTYNYSYELNGRTVTRETTIRFDWYFLDDNLILHNPDEFFFEDFEISDFDNKSWRLRYDQGDGIGCAGVAEIHYIERE